jgi:fibronectin-binding autotransporter adhesin
VEDVLYEGAPVLSVTGASPSAVQGGPAVDLTTSVTVTDTLQNIASATVTISSGRQTGDTLSFHSGTSNWVFADGTINETYNSGTGVLTLSGVASAADYQAALDSVSFATTASTGASRTFSWSTTDGHLASTTPTSSATVLTNATAPTITSGASASEAENTAASNVVYTVTATDPDVVGTVTFSLTGTERRASASMPPAARSASLSRPTSRHRLTPTPTKSTTSSCMPMTGCTTPPRTSASR